MNMTPGVTIYFQHCSEPPGVGLGVGVHAVPGRRAANLGCAPLRITLEPKQRS